MEDILLPLFPLEVVLLPEEILPLHIFEKRYKEMIGECLAAQSSGKGQSEFGIVLAKGREICNIGCTAQISRVTRKYVDGRMISSRWGSVDLKSCLLMRKNPICGRGLNSLRMSRAQTRSRKGISAAP